MGELCGKTRLQKLIFILKNRTKEDIDLEYGYEIYLHGPFSADLVRLVNQLIDQGFIEEKQRTTQTGNMLFEYQVTPRGRAFIGELESKRCISQSLTKAIDDVVENYGYIPLPILIEHAYETFESLRNQ